MAETKSALERDLDDKELQINAHKRDQQKSSRKLKTQLSQQEVIFQLFELYLKSLRGFFFEWLNIRYGVSRPYCRQFYKFAMSIGRII